MKNLQWENYVKGEFVVEAARAGNDVYGNPLYRVRLPHGTQGWARTFFYLARKKHLYRYYEAKDYGLMQSYNIAWDMEALLDTMLEHQERAKRVGAN